MTTQKKTAVLYRMETDTHTCPFGLRTKDVLKRSGYQIDEQILTSKEEVDSIKQKLGVNTTPQVVINEDIIGGYEDTRRFLGKSVKDKNQTSYFPVISLFAVAALTTLAVNYSGSYVFTPVTSLMSFVGFSMIMLGLLKLQNLEGFVNGFLGYDLLARRYVPYAFVYPFAEVFAGLLMIAKVLPWVSVPVMLFIGGIGTISVFKAVYIEKRDLKCACVGGGSNVPLGLVSLLENVVMVAAAIWMVGQCLK